VALVAPHYRVGSFDDDASYLLSAKALLAGQGLTGHLTSGEPLVGLYLPGYGALLAPFVWLFPHSFLLPRLLSVVAYAASFPLVWLFLHRRGMSDGEAAAALILLALCPVDATFASMVMAETPFLVILLLLLLALDRWLESDRAVGRWGWAVLIAVAALLWLKQAGLGLVVGLVLWLPFTRTARRWRRAAFLAAGAFISVLPVLIARLVVGLPLAGDRYSMELGGFYQGGLIDRLLHVLPGSVQTLFSTAIPATLVPYYGPLPDQGFARGFWSVLAWQVTALCIIGAVVAFRRRRDGVMEAMVVVYLGESVLWPFVNERRVILVLPIMIAWYVMGASALWGALRRRVGARPGGGYDRAQVAAGILVASAVTFVPLAAQMPKDYLFPWNVSSSDPGGSRYVELLAALGPRSAVIETSYRSTFALFTGHPTAWNAFLDDPGPCSASGARMGIAEDHAGFLVTGDFNKPDLIDDPCLAALAQTAPWAVPLLHTGRDQASVYELVGPGTGHPDLVPTVTAATPLLRTSEGDRSLWTWQWSTPVPVTQVSVGEAAAESGPTESVVVEVRAASGEWTTLTEARSGVGGCAGCRPFLLSEPSPAPEATAVRVVVTAVSPAVVEDLAVIGPGGTGLASSPTRSRQRPGRT
jgi:hypothetical protein